MKAVFGDIHQYLPIPLFRVCAYARRDGACPFNVLSKLKTYFFVVFLHEVGANIIPNPF